MQRFFQRAAGASVALWAGSLGVILVSTAPAIRAAVVAAPAAAVPRTGAAVGATPVAAPVAPPVATDADLAGLAESAPQVLKLLRRRERWLVVAAVRFLRTALNMKVQRGSGLACGSGCVCVWQAGANLGCLGHASAGAAA